MQLKKTVLFVYGLFLSSIISLMSYTFIMLEGNFSHAIWHVSFSNPLLRVFYTFMVVFGCTAVVYRLKKRWGNLPITTHDAMKEMKTSQKVIYHKFWRSLIVALLVLMSGAGVGPEAPLLGAVIACSVWQADKMRYIYTNYEQIFSQNWKHRLKYFLHPTRFLLSYSENTFKMDLKKKKILNILYIINGVGLFFILMRLSDQPSFITKMGTVHFKIQQLVFLPILIAYGYVFSLIYQKVKNIIITYLNAFTLSLRTRLLLGGLAIFIVVLFVPQLMFSGQYEMTNLAISATQLTSLSLFFLSVGKLVFLDICLYTTWTGGDIFPITLASILQGFFVAKLFPQVDTVFIVAIVSFAICGLLIENTWLGCIFVSFFFPKELFVFAVIIALLLQMPKYIRKFNQRGTVDE